MKQIQISKGLYTVVDDEDFERLNHFKWYAKPNFKTVYAERNIRFLNGEQRQKKMLMHHDILTLPNGMQTDHIDGNGLNNQKSNLRLVTNRENSQNKHTKKSSRFPGVCWYKDSKKWVSRININGVKKYLGLFVSEEEAAIAYRVAERVLCGEQG
jgi:hypothetical protein